MVLAQKQKYRPMEQNRKPRNKPMHIWTPYIWQRRQEYATAAAKLLQSCPNLCDTIDGSPPGSSVPGILQARKLEYCHFLLQCRKVKSQSEVAQSCPALCDPMDCSLPGSSVHGISQARVLEWVAIAFSRQEYTMEQRQPLQYMVLGKLDSYMQKNEIRTLPNTIHKDKLKMD